MAASRREQGVAEWTEPNGRVTTLQTFTCAHCNNVTIIAAGAKADDCGGFCRMCMKPTCTACADGACTPFEKQLEASEARGRLRRQIGGAP